MKERESQELDMKCRRIVSFSVVVLFLVVLAASSFSVERRRLPGIWKLKSDSLPFEPDIRSKLQGLINGKSPEEVLLKLNSDGSFKQCNEGYSEGRWLAGRWKINDDQQLVLALRRQYYGPQFDILLEGPIDGTSTLRVEGKIQKGKFLYPQKHPAFFESPLINQETIGTFALEQSIATFSITSVRLQDPDKPNHFEKADFCERHFILTIEAKKKLGNDEPLDLSFDLRAMPIHFHANNTFQAIGINKILRGRFDTTENDQLSFQVSLFGMGRSVSGSVYSEGLGLTHEDERCYIGSIVELDGKLRVEGTVTFGADMGTDARPEPVGNFIMIETLPNDENDCFDDVTDEGRGVFE